MKSICTLAIVTVAFAEGGRTFRAGDVVDLDAMATPAQTWADALGKHAATFVPEDEDPETEE